MSTEKKVKMEYRMLGGTGLKVSCFGYGYYGTFGAKEKGKGRIQEAVKNSLPILKKVREAGINFFDNAEAYGAERGDSEEIMGLGIEALRKENPELWRRSDIVCTTKIFWGGKGENENGLSRKHLIEAMNASLKRLKMDYVDLVFCHRPDPFTPTEEVVRAMSQIVNDGKALYWGTSQWTAQKYTEAFYIAKILKLVPPSCEQCQYNLFEREKVEKEHLRLFNHPYKMGITMWGPLCSGWLTGKYNNGIPKNSRLAQYSYLRTDLEKKQKDRIPKIIKLGEYAKKKFNTSSTVISIAWCCKNKNISVCLLGASKLYQIEENLKALEIAAKMTEEDMKAIDEIFQTKPEPLMDTGRVVKKIINTN